MVSINNLFVAFGDRVLFDHVSMFIGIQDKIGLVGKNGAGKSTLLKIIMGFDKPLEGNISKSSEVTIGYLAQELEMDTSISVREACRAVFGDFLSLEKRKK
jgi:ATP-binding cassette subfamily F protein 3